MAVVMSVFPLTVPVTRCRPGPDVTDPLGNPVPGPMVEEQVLVFGYSLGSSDEPNLSGHVERVDSDASLIAGSGDFSPSDEVVLPEWGRFVVEGRPANFDNNPWWSPGVETISLRKVEG